MAFCNLCGTQIPEGATTCAACAGRAPYPPAAAVPGGGLADNVAALLAYFTIPAILFLLIEPYNKNRFVRFHAFQAIFLMVAWLGLMVVLGILTHIPVLGWLMAFFIMPIIMLAGFILWLILLIKASQRQMWKLPVIGDLAEKQADAM
jgi:uncharacterized membrane protein